MDDSSGRYGGDMTVKNSTSERQTPPLLLQGHSVLALTPRPLSQQLGEGRPGTRPAGAGRWSAGRIATTSHGVERDENLAVELGDGTRHSAALVGRDPDTDLALLRVQATGLPAVQPAEPGDVKVGHLVLALARPGSSGLQATIGIISARMDTERNGTLGYILHTDAVLYPGFSRSEGPRVGKE